MKTKIRIVEEQRVILCSCKIAKAVDEGLMFRDANEELCWTLGGEIITTKEFIDNEYGEEYWNTNFAILLDAEFKEEEGMRTRIIYLC